MLARTNSPVVGIVTGIAVVLLILLIAFSFNLAKMQKNYQNETSEKMKIEEKVNSLTQLVTNLTEEKNKIDSELSKYKLTGDVLAKELIDLKKQNESYKEEMEKLNKLKDKLSDELKEALYKANPKKTKE